MDIYVMDGLNGVADVVSTYQSVIWNVQYFGNNDFQLIVNASEENLNALQVGRYIVRSEDISGDTFNNVMIIENYQLDFDPEKGWVLTVTGRGLKTICGRRVVWNQTNMTGLAEVAIRNLITENIINPANTLRKIDNFILDAINNFEETIEMQLYGENIGDWLVEICTTYNYGWDVYISDGKYVFKLYKGVNRTYNQSAVAPVVFSPEFDNLLSSSYKYNKADYKNAALILGEGEGADKRRTSVGVSSGLDRFEAYIDGSSVSSNGEIITLETYLQMLQEYGQSQIDQTAFTQKFSGDIDPAGLYVINQDYFLGDVVQVENEKGIKATPRIIEIIYAEDENGSSVVPTFSEWEVN